MGNLNNAESFPDCEDSGDKNIVSKSEHSDHDDSTDEGWSFVR